MRAAKKKNHTYFKDNTQKSFTLQDFFLFFFPSTFSTVASQNWLLALSPLDNEKSEMKEVYGCYTSSNGIGKG